MPMHRQPNIWSVAVFLSLLLSFQAVNAQSETTPTPSGYGALLDTEIRGLSPETIETYRTGAGGGLALPAELNGYPGPRHVLNLAAELTLTQDQQEGVQALYD